MCVNVAPLRDIPPELLCCDCACQGAVSFTVSVLGYVSNTSFLCFCPLHTLLKSQHKEKSTKQDMLQVSVSFTEFSPFCDFYLACFHKVFCALWFVSYGVLRQHFIRIEMNYFKWSSVLFSRVVCVCMWPAVVQPNPAHPCLCPQWLYLLKGGKWARHRHCALVWLLRYFPLTKTPLRDLATFLSGTRNRHNSLILC